MHPTLLESEVSDEVTSREPIIPDVMQQLRSATAITHKSVEQKTPFFKSNFDRPRLLDWTKCMLGFYRPFECALAGSPLLTSGRWAYRFRTPLLTGDLAWLGEPQAGAHPPARLARVPDLTDPMKALGALYVVEGSALGGQVLAARIAKTLGLTSDNGASFYQPNGRDPRPVWEKFQSLVRNASTHSAAQQAIVAGAVATFQAFDHWLVDYEAHTPLN